MSSVPSRPALEPTQPPVKRVKRPGREADHSPAFSAEVKNGAAIFPLPHIVFMAWYLMN
jgi:hypothetical protein